MDFLASNVMVFYRLVNFEGTRTTWHCILERPICFQSLEKLCHKKLENYMLQKLEICMSHKSDTAEGI